MGGGRRRPDWGWERRLGAWGIRVCLYICVGVVGCGGGFVLDGLQSC
jgi:hypothetical protein